METESMTQEQARWKAESDAHTLANAAIIADDPTRLNSAKDAATRMADEVQKTATELRAVSNKAAPKPKTTRAAAKKTTKRKATTTKRSNGGHPLMPL